MKSSAWYALFPNDPYAIGPFRFERPISEREFRAYLRWWEGCWIGRELRRLPAGVQVRPAR